MHRSLLIFLSACVIHTAGLQAYAQAELSIKMVPAISIAGPSGEYQIQRAQVLGNATNWITITNVTLSGSPFIFFDITAGNTQQYYQAVQRIVTDNPNPQLLVWIPPGAFIMGSPWTEHDRGYDEGPQTKVTISQGFWMGKYEVTQQEFQNVMGTNPSYFTGDLNWPVEQVTWEDATNYCSKLTQQERAAGRLPWGYMYRLPTEAEWEYACRAGTTTRFSYGDDLNYTSVGNYAWYWDNSWYSNQPNGISLELNGKYYTLHPVSQKLPNPWGLYDMHGNVWEWCLDWYGAYSGGSALDPKGPASGSFHVRRGGSWGYEGRHCRSAHRGNEFDFFGNSMGFRPVLAPAKTVDSIVIALKPESTAVTNRATVILQVEATGPTGLRYQWQKEGVDIAGQTNRVLTLSNVETNNSGTYTVVVSYDGRWLVSNPAIVIVQKEMPDNPNPQLLVWIPPGDFRMGSSSAEQGRDPDKFDEGPLTTVTISKGFWMRKYEVTQQEFQNVMGNNPSYFTGDQNRPVEQVSWYDAADYCSKLTQQERAAGRLPWGYMYRLPTEAEWEYACRAGTSTRFSYGDDLNYTNLVNYAWYNDNSWYSSKPNGGSYESGGKYYITHPVGQKLPNPWGLYDMHGNVWEWCLDMYANSHPGGSVTDPVGSRSVTGFVLRGGSWWHTGDNSRSASRDNMLNILGNSVGFRPVLAVPIQ